MNVADELKLQYVCVCVLFLDVSLLSLLSQSDPNRMFMQRLNFLLFQTFNLSP